MLKLYPSSIDFSLSGLNLAEYNSGCWRWILYTQGVWSNIDPVYGAIGAAHEDWYEGNKLSGLEYKKEVPFKFQVGNATISGRCDFELSNRIDECKSTLDASKLISAPQRPHLAQLTIYLAHFNIEQGNLAYGSYMETWNGAEGAFYVEKLDGFWKQTGFRNVPVRLDDSGRVFVDNVRTDWKVDDVVGTIAALEQHHSEDIVPERPPVFGFKHACKYCPAAAVCAKYEIGEATKEELKAGVRFAAQTKELHKAKWKKEKAPKPPKAATTKRKRNVTEPST